MKEHLLFLQRFLRKGGKVGSVAPSSRFLVRALVKMVPFAGARVLVELGGGTGTVSAAILKARRPETRLVIFEPDETFCEFLRNKFEREKNVAVVRKNAEDLRLALSGLGVAPPDCVISSIPFASIGKSASKKIFSEIRASLAPDGLFVFYQYTPIMIPEVLRYFEIKKTVFTPWNVPPAFAFRCSPIHRGFKR